MKVAVIGLGSIAQKAYLPTIAARPGVDLRLMTRSRDRLDQVADTYRVPADRRFDDLERLLDGGVDAAFVHVPTDGHQAVVGRLLEAGVPTYVDKPLDSTLAGARLLAERAQTLGVLLSVGFNRRYAPAYVAATDRRRDLILLQKNTIDSPGEVREIVYDDFIHVVDTLRFLLPGEIERTTVSGRVDDGVLHHVVLTLSGSGCTAVGAMHRRAGVKEERLEVTGDAGKFEVLDLVDVSEGSDGVRGRLPVDGWNPVAAQRGFTQICTAFLEDVRAGRTSDLQDALRTHELCEDIVTTLAP